MNYINFKSADAAELWAKEVDTLNETTMQLLQKVGTCLQSLKEDADSTVVDEIYHYGGNVLQGAVSVVGGMGAVTASIRQIVRYLEEINRNGVDTVHSIIRDIGGFETAGAVGAGGSPSADRPKSFQDYFQESQKERRDEMLKQVFPDRPKSFQDYFQESQNARRIKELSVSRKVRT